MTSNSQHLKATLFLFILTHTSLFAATSPDSVQLRDLPADEIYEAFRNPPAEARPFVRWWWNNDQLEEAEILRELDVLKAAGIGGVEINPIAGPKKPEESKAKQLVWRSPEWDHMLHVACKGAKERGMTVDLIAGSGWPFGGEFLAPEERIMRFTVKTTTIDGGVRAHVDLGKLVGEGRKEIRFVKVHPKNLFSLDEVRDVTSTVNADRMLDVDLAAGTWIVSCGVFESGYCDVQFGVPGAAGPTMDHMQKRVTRAYLDRLSNIEKTWGEPLSNQVRAVFCDSIETTGANWTHDILTTFKQQKGYDIEPWLPFVVGTENTEIVPSPELRDRIKRARYDWSEHVVAEFLKNFTAEYSSFCHDHGLLSRYQSYGIPWYMGMAEGYMLCDIPEANNWLYSQKIIDPMSPPRFTWNQAHGYMIWAKYAATAAHLRDKKITSCEAMTNTAKVFHATLGTIKQADDMNFITGINHSILHGYNYVPPDVPFPGWIRFGTYFSEHNTWWPYFPRWVDYNSRLSSVFQSTRPVAEVAILGPTADHWSVTGLVRDPIHMKPDYLHRLWEPLSQLGIASDYLHEGVMKDATAQDGRLRIGPMSYQLLIVTNVESLLPTTAEAIRNFATKGGKVVFVDRMPDRAPSMPDAGTGDARVKDAGIAALRAGAISLAGPSEKADLTELRDWTNRMLDRLHFNQSFKVLSPRDGLYSMRKKAKDADVFFITNTYRKESSHSRINFPLGTSGLWRWNPETGERSPYEHPYDTNGFEIDLRPLESVLLVTGTKPKPSAKTPAETARSEPYVINTPWELTFKPSPSNESFTTSIPSLIEFTQSNDARIRTFAGTAVYRTSFELKDASHTRLDLGWDNDFISEVELNGRNLGVNWYGSRLFDLKGALKVGTNQLTIRYTTTLWNAMGKEPLQPSGLIGPVQLLKIQKSDP